MTPQLQSTDNEQDNNTNSILFDQRKLFLYDEITESSSRNIIKNLRALDCISHNPITLEICSGGGNCDCGFAIINTINVLQSKVITLINGTACSMAGLISIAGDVRVMFDHSWWMAHDMSGGIGGDYSRKVEDRSEYIKASWNNIKNYLKNHTKLTIKQIESARTGELWLNTEQAYKYKVIDYVLRPTIKKNNPKILLNSNQVKINL